jgi:hypothetical protein
MAKQQTWWRLTACRGELGQSCLSMSDRYHPTLPPLALGGRARVIVGARIIRVGLALNVKLRQIAPGEVTDARLLSIRFQKERHLESQAARSIWEELGETIGAHLPCLPSDVTPAGEGAERAGRHYIHVCASHFVCNGCPAATAETDSKQWENGCSPGSTLEVWSRGGL